MNINALEDFLKSVPNLRPMIQISDSEAWFKIGTEFGWIKGGDVYSGESTEGFDDDGNWLIVNINNGCGEVVTELFDKSKEMTSDAFYDLYEEFM